MNKVIDVAIVGAGPYGLSIAAHLRRLRATFRIFGGAGQPPTSLTATGVRPTFVGRDSNSSGPDHSLTLEQRTVESVDRCADLFLLRLDDEQLVTARQMVIATGLGAFRRLPAQLAHLPPEQCSHRSAHLDLAGFRGSDVTVVSDGESTLDLVEALDAQGATVRLVSCEPFQQLSRHTQWLQPPLWRHTRQSGTAIMPGFRRLLFGSPMLFYRLPETMRRRVLHLCLDQWGEQNRRIASRHPIPLLLDHRITHAESSNGRLRLQIAADDGSHSLIQTDHIIAATGYTMDLRRLALLGSEVRTQLRCFDLMPVLSSTFESSVAGLYFVGAIAAASFGPAMLLASGTGFAAPRLCKRLDRCAWLSLLAGTAD